LAHPFTGSQVSTVHGLLSLQLSGGPTHAPPLQWSSVVQTLPSSQLEPF
jgi:hypothetical protein